MSKLVYIKITDAGGSVSPTFDLYANGITLIGNDVLLAELLGGYVAIAPDDTTFVSIIGTTGCGDIDLYCVSTTTTTTTGIPPTTTTTTTHDITKCLIGMSIECFYLDKYSDYQILNNTWYPKPTSPTDLHRFNNMIGGHDCDAALFYVKGNGVYIGDMLMNNDDSTRGYPEFATPSGNTTGVDYHNTWVPIMELNMSSMSRYSNIIITEQQAIDIAAESGNLFDITFTFECPMTPYNCHEFVSWVLIKDARGTILYNGMPNEGFATIDICQEYPPEPGLGLYYRMVNCNSEYCYITPEEKLTLEGTLGTFEIGDRFYINPLGYQEHLYTWENVLQYFDVLPPSCVISYLERTTDECET